MRRGSTPEIMVTSQYRSASPEALRAAGVRPAEKPQRLIDDFSRGLHDWTGTLDNRRGWQIKTRKICDPRWVGPRGAELVFELNVPAAGAWIGAVVERRFRSQNSGAFRCYAFLRVAEGGWGTVRFRPGDFQNIYGEKLDGWQEASSLTLGDAADLARDKQRLLPRAGQRAVPAIPTDVSSWDNSYYQSDADDYAAENIDKRGDGPGRLRAVRWEGGQYQ